MTRIFKIAFIGLLALPVTTLAQDKSNKQIEVDATPTVSSLEQYTQIDRVKLPQLVKDALAKDYLEMTVAQAFKTPEKSYKIVLVAQDQRSTRTVYATADGKWIKDEDEQ